MPARHATCLLALSLSLAALSTCSSPSHTAPSSASSQAAPSSATIPQSRSLAYTFKKVDPSWTVQKEMLRPLPNQQGLTTFAGEAKPGDIVQLLYFRNNETEPVKIIRYDAQNRVRFETDIDRAPDGERLSHHARTFDVAGSVISYEYGKQGTEEAFAIGPDGKRREVKNGHGMLVKGTQSSAQQTWYHAGRSLIIKEYANAKCTRVVLYAGTFGLALDPDGEWLVHFDPAAPHWNRKRHGEPPTRYSHQMPLGGSDFPRKRPAEPDRTAEYSAERSALITLFLKNLDASGWTLSDLDLPSFATLEAPHP